jgi:hypothetical protein
MLLAMFSWIRRDSHVGDGRLNAYLSVEWCLLVRVACGGRRQTEQKMVGGESYALPHPISIIIQLLATRFRRL